MKRPPSRNVKMDHQNRLKRVVHSFQGRLMRQSARSGLRVNRTGFTLLETMLALSISALLLAGIYAAIDQSWKTSASGREEMERAQLARALIRRFETDIRAITFVPPPPEEAEEEEATITETSTTTSSTSSDSATTEDTTPNSKSIGLRGTNYRMDISIARARRDLLPGMTAGMNGAPSVAAALRTSDLRQVSYSFVAPGSGTVSGLIRTEGDRMAVETLEANGGTGAQISTVQPLAAEIATFGLRYFDGRIWMTVWDSDALGRIPRAVEISFTFQPPKRKPSLFSAPVSKSLDTFRTVIMIPISDPFPKDFIQ